MEAQELLPAFLSEELERRRALSSLVLDSLPESLRGGFVRPSLNGDTLTIFFNFPPLVREFEERRAEILEKMRTLYKERGCRSIFLFKNIRASVLILSNFSKRQSLFCEQGANSLHPPKDWGCVHNPVLADLKEGASCKEMEAKKAREGRFSERSSGNFRNCCEDPRLRALFEEIRRSIVSSNAGAPLAKEQR